MYRYRLRPLAPFHFGERGIGIEETAALPHSDTLFAALVSAWRLLGGTDLVEELLAPFPIDGDDSEPPFRLSSAFPYAGPVDFLPRPAVYLQGDGGDVKRGKNVTYVSWNRLRTLLESDTPLPRVSSQMVLHTGELWVTGKERDTLAQTFPGESLEHVRFWYAGESAMTPRVTVDRTTSASAVYYQGQVRFRDGCGLYLLADFAGSEAQQKRYREYVHAGLELLGEQGLGGRRSVGLGRFDVIGAEDVTLPGVGDAANLHLVLSLYHPTADEVAAGILDRARYELIMRRGWMRSPDRAGLRRKGIRMLAEGAIVGNKPTGDVVDVRPAPRDGLEVPHPVYRSGLALSVPCGRWTHV